MSNALFSEYRISTDLSQTGSRMTIAKCQTESRMSTADCQT